MTPRIGLVAVAGLALASCDLSMTRQARPRTGRSLALWQGGPSAAAAPDGTVAFGEARGPETLPPRPPISPTLLARGEARYRIYCTPCHGVFGDGDGRVVGRGFPHPPSYDLPRLRAAPPEHFVEVIGHGYGVMYGYGDRITPQDRWAIAAYVRALQLAHDEIRRPGTAR